MKCDICSKPIQIQIFQGSGVCSENCRKVRDESPKESRTATSKDAGMVEEEWERY